MSHTVYLLRHGESETNAMRMFGSRTINPPLTEAGIKQITKQAESLKDVSFDAAYASTLRRTRQSAGIVSRKNNLDIEFSENLMEIDLGNLEGKTFEETWETYQGVLNSWQDGNFNSGFPGGETFNDVKHRLNEFLDNIDPADKNNILVVGHGLLFMVILWHFCEHDGTGIHEYGMGRGHLSVISGNDKIYSMVKFNISP